MVSEETESEWRRLGPAEASETCRERVRGQGPVGQSPPPPTTLISASVTASAPDPALLSPQACGPRPPALSSHDSLVPEPHPCP